MMSKLNFFSLSTLCFITTLTACGSGGGDPSQKSGISSDYTAPTVASTTPANGATGFAINSAIVATLSEPMDAATITDASFTLNNGATGTVTYSGTTVTFTPANNLLASTLYTATITTAAKDIVGNALAAPYTWTFMTGALPDTTAPTVTSTTPVTNTQGVSVKVTPSAVFSEVMTADTLNPASFTLNNGATGTVTYSGTTVTFTPANILLASTPYTATITTAAKDAAGNALAAPYTWTFTTGTVVDTTAPTVTSTTPANNAENVSVKVIPSAVFSEVMTAATLTPASFTLNNSASGAVAYNGTTATFTPNPQLNYATAYTATIASTVKDAAGNVMAVPYTWTFTTRAAPINDTGITANQCYELDTDVFVSCSYAAPTALNAAQDGMVGRDANSASNIAGDGKLGFSFTAVTGGCVLDNVTGLMWEVKTADGGLRDWNNTYTHYDSTTALQVGATLPPPTQAEIDAMSNSIGFKNAVNSSNLCGFADWRLPTRNELQSIVDFGVPSPGSTVDTNWFPNTQNKFYLSASPTVWDATLVWGIQFVSGSSGMSLRRVITDPSYEGRYLRLVRAGQ